jgi:hypothetical protein
MTESEEIDFDAWFRKFNSWDLSYNQLLTLAVAGDDEGEVVWKNPHGQAMTRYVCRSWIVFYGAAQAGWNARAKLATAPDSYICKKCGEDIFKEGHKECDGVGCPLLQSFERALNKALEKPRHGA